MRTVLVFDLEIRGHHLEYIHHIYEGYAMNTSTQCVFVVPISFQKLKENFIWSKADNIKFDFIEEEVCDDILCRGKFMSSICASMLLRKYIRKYKVDEIFLVFLMMFMPFLPLMTTSKISGIIYDIYLYRWKEEGVAKKLKDAVRFWLLAKMSVFNRIFVLNSSSSFSVLNRIWKTNKFMYLPDPILDDNIAPFSVKSTEDKIVLHFGAMTRRKGTLAILDGIKNLKNSQKKEFCFVFAGQVTDEIRKEFYSKYKQLSSDTKIILYDCFCSYDQLSSLLSECYCILAPYQKTSQSSGVVGYAAKYNKPIIIIKKGMLWKMVRDIGNGIPVEDVSKEFLSIVLNEVGNKYVDKNKCQKYVLSHSIDEFKSIICAK